MKALPGGFGRSMGLVAGLVILVACWSAEVTRSEVVTLRIDPSLSSVSVSARFRNRFGELLPLVEQSAHSLTASLSGTVLLDIDASIVSFSIGANAATLPGVYLPARQGDAPGAGSVANLAGQVINRDANAQGLYAARDLALGVVGGDRALGPSGVLAAAGDVGLIAWNQAFFTGSSNGGGFTGYPFRPTFGLNGSGELGRIELLGSQISFWFPFDFPWSIGPFSADLVPVSGSLYGRIVARSVVPECSSVFLALGVFCVLCAASLGRDKGGELSGPPGRRHGRSPCHPA